jgi:hypothetical protein
MVYLSSLITDSYDIYAIFPVAKLEDLQNKRINAPGTAPAGFKVLVNPSGRRTDHLLHEHTDRCHTGALSFASGIQPDPRV